MWHTEPKVNPVKNWSRHFIFVGFKHLLGVVVALVASTRWVHRRNHHNIRRELHRRLRTSDCHNPILKWLTETIDGTTVKFRKFIHEKYTSMLERYFAWSWNRSTANECNM